MSDAPTPSRPPPPAVPPVEHAGVRYSQDSSPPAALAATDAATGKPLWRLKVYEDANDPNAPTTMPRYFRSMRLAAGGSALEIEDETGCRYRVDLAARTATWLNPPPSAPPAQAKPK